MKRSAENSKMFFKQHLFLLWIAIAPVFIQAQNAFKLNQCGFYPAANKIAVFTGIAAALNFYITSINGTDTFYTGILSEQRQSAYS